MKKQFIVAIIASLSLFIASFAFASLATGPEVSDLTHFVSGQPTKPAVVFQHAKHQKRMKGDCSKCHGENNVLLNLKTGKPLDVSHVDLFDAQFHDNFCFSCHDTLKVDVGRNCDSCHVGTR